MRGLECKQNRTAGAVVFARQPRPEDYSVLFPIYIHKYQCQYSASIVNFG